MISASWAVPPTHAKPRLIALTENGMIEYIKSNRNIQSKNDSAHTIPSCTLYITHNFQYSSLGFLWMSGVWPTHGRID